MLCDVSLIDLDLARPVDPAPSARVRWDELRRSTRRPVVAVLAVLSLLGSATLGGSAPDGVPGLDPVLAIAAPERTGEIILGENALFVVEQQDDMGQQDDGNVVRRHTFTGGGADWAVPIPASGHSVVLDRAANVLLASTYVGDVSTLAIDADTGATLWRQPSVVHLMTANGVALLIPPITEEAAPTVVEAVQVRTGAQLWSRAFDAAASLLSDTSPEPAARASGTVWVAPDGTVSTIAVADGAILASRDLDVTPPTHDDLLGDFVESGVVDDVLYVARHRAGRDSLTAYRIDTLRVLWSTDGVAGWITACAPVVCVSDHRGTTGVDPRSGERRWTTTAGNHPEQRPDGRLLLGDGQEHPTVVSLDARTGRIRAHLGESYAVSGSGRLVLRKARTSVLHRRIMVVDGSAPSGRFLGRLAISDADRCVANDLHLACLSVPGRITVWRVRWPAGHRSGR